MDASSISSIDFRTEVFAVVTTVVGTVISAVITGHESSDTFAIVIPDNNGGGGGVANGVMAVIAVSFGYKTCSSACGAGVGMTIISSCNILVGPAVSAA